MHIKVVAGMVLGIALIGTALTIRGLRDSDFEEGVENQEDSPIRSASTSPDRIMGGHPLQSNESAPRRASPGRDFQARMNAVLCALPSEGRNKELSNLLEEWVIVDATGALQAADHVEPADLRTELVREILQLWAGADGEAALAWVSRQNAADRDAALATVVTALVERHAKSIPELLRDRADLKLSPDLIVRLATQWCVSDRDAALAWAETQPPGAGRDALMSRIAVAHASENPRWAAQLALAQIAPGEAQVEAVIAVVHQWALRDPAGAAEWAALFPEGRVRTRALNELNGIAQYRRDDR